MQALQNIPAEYIAPLTANITAIREYIFTTDCYRTIFILVLGTALLALFQLKKLPYALPQCVTVEMVNEKSLCLSIRGDYPNSTIPDDYQAKPEHTVGKITFGSGPTTPTKSNLFFEEED